MGDNTGSDHTKSNTQSVITHHSIYSKATNSCYAANAALEVKPNINSTLAKFLRFTILNQVYLLTES